MTPVPCPSTRPPRHLPDYEQSAVSYLMLHGMTRTEALDVVANEDPETVRNLHAAHMAEADEMARRVEFEKALADLRDVLMRPVERLLRRLPWT